MIHPPLKELKEAQNTCEIPKRSFSESLTSVLMYTLPWQSGFSEQAEISWLYWTQAASLLSPDPCWRRSRWTAATQALKAQRQAAGTVHTAVTVTAKRAQYLLERNSSSYTRCSYGKETRAVTVSGIPLQKSPSEPNSSQFNLLQVPDLINK